MTAGFLAAANFLANGCDPSANFSNASGVSPKMREEKKLGIEN